MEQQNPPEIAKRLWSIVRIMYYMLRRGVISKGKFMDDLNTMIRRGKTVRKAIQNVIFHYSSAQSSSSATTTFVAPKDYEFSCSNTPAFFPFSVRKNKIRNNHSNLSFACAFAPETTEDDRDAVDAVKKVLEMLNSNKETIVESSPALTGFGPSPAVRQFRVTESPFPSYDTDEDSRVDEKAEKFIARFYSGLGRQKIMASPGPW